MALAAPKADDPTITVHLHRTPHEPDHAKFTEVDFWHVKDTLLPVMVRTDDNSENESIVTIKDASINQPIDAKVFDTTAPTEAGWQVEITPWEEK